MTRRLTRELRSLFGPAVLDEASRTDPATLDLSAPLMDAVHTAADTLLAQRGDVSAQRATVAALPADVRLVLCLWVLDTGLAAKILRAAADAEVNR